MKEGASLTDIFPLRVERQMKTDIAVLNAHRVDVAAMVRNFLRREIPKAKKKLTSA